MGKRRNQDGRFTPEHTDADILAAVRAHEPAATSEVADEVGMTRQGADRRLRGLRDAGRVSSKKIGASLVWFAPTGESGRESREPTPNEPADRYPSPSPATAHGDDRADRIDADLIDQVATDVLPGSGGKLEARREALHATVEYLREHGKATPSDFRTDVYPEYDGRYTDGKDPARSWWKNCIYKGLGELADRTDEIDRPDTTGEWSYQGGV